MPRPIRFGIVCGGVPSFAGWAELARRAEALGYSSVLLPDRLQVPLAIDTALAVAAAVTTHLRVGSHVLCNDLRHPALVAREAATLDVLSGGRVELGVGAGVNASDYQRLGVPFAAPGIRVGRVEEAVQIIKRLFSGETVDFAGQYYTITGLRGLPQPVQQPHVPIFIGSGGKRLLSFAAREADIIEPVAWPGPPGAGPPEPSLAEKVEWVRAAAGARFAELELSQSVFGLVLTDSPAPVPPAGGGPPIPPTPLTTEAAIAQLQELRDQLGFTYFTIREGQMENFAPVVARLAGM
ncbi:MAG TPA: TIGR03621 family F420-dependent LLM class oxidoreductase [Chloroflexia bacterium]|nr:TIGR03621 family F420-dependent LLM class oxidoreductase [Chloroflexia bacterium]